MLLCHFNNKLESDLRCKYDLPPEVPVSIEWSDDGSCVWAIVVGNTDGVFSFIDYAQVQGLLQEFFMATSVRMLDEYYWPHESSARAFEAYKESVGITDPKITCAAQMDKKYLAKWDDVFNQRCIIEIIKEA